MEELEFTLEEPIMDRYIYYFDENINVESVQSLIDHLCNYPKVDLYFSTNGGEIIAMKVLIKFLNNHPDIKIYLTELIASAGTFLLTDCTKELILDEHLDAILFHMGDRAREGEFRKTSLDWNILREQLREKNLEDADKFARIGLNKKEIKSYLDGNDVVLYRNDFKRLKLNQNK